MTPSWPGSPEGPWGPVSPLGPWGPRGPRGPRGPHSPQPRTQHAAESVAWAVFAVSRAGGGDWAAMAMPPPSGKTPATTAHV
ncbi:hypothetical protein FXF65_03175 [Actinomadura syzygii]|uniref:Uncharacterized protein n=1 Tax=Actinomadura syzygii TaxID=1427538 RepID=A0A5D0UK49_9ACTN|nr:hypothetical protein FXF65_03175 [Actinomadura syzygii]